METITLDFETFYDRDYSLSKMRTEEYILDERYETIMVDIKLNNNHTVIMGTEDEIKQQLHDFCDWSKYAVRAHHVHFDGFILAHRYGIKPALWKCTLSQARMLHPHLRSHSLANLAKHFKLQDKGSAVHNMLGKRLLDMTNDEVRDYITYCAGDVDICEQLGEMFDKLTPPLEMYLIDMTVRMFTEPMFVGDTDLIKDLLYREIERKRELMELAELERDVIMSSEKFAERLRELGVEPPMKISPRTDKKTYAFAKTDKAFTNLLEHDDDRVVAVVAARLGAKTTIAETRTQRFLDMSREGRLPVYLNFWGAKTTGRYSGGNKCLSGDSWITVLRSGEVLDILMSSLKEDDLVWDGQEFVNHAGLVCNGYAEVIEYERVIGTADHKVYVVGREEPVELGVAASQGLMLQTGDSPERVEQAS